jgi:hypothetical protein
MAVTPALEAELSSRAKEASKRRSIQESFFFQSNRFEAVCQATKTAQEPGKHFRKRQLEEPRRCST